MYNFFKLYYLLFESQNGYQNGTCLNVVGVRAQNMIAIVRSTIKIIRGDLYDRIYCLQSPPLGLLDIEEFIQMIDIWVMECTCKLS